MDSLAGCQPSLYICIHDRQCGRQVLVFWRVYPVHARYLVFSWIKLLVSKSWSWDELWGCKDLEITWEPRQGTKLAKPMLAKSSMNIHNIIAFWAGRGPRQVGAKLLWFPVRSLQERVRTLGKCTQVQRQKRGCLFARCLHVVLLHWILYCG